MPAPNVEQNSPKTDLCRPTFMLFSATTSCAFKSIAAKTPIVIGRVHRPRARCLAAIPILTRVKLQCEQGALHSYRQAEDNLGKLNCQRRSVNNHVQIQHISNSVGERLSHENQKPPNPEELSVPAEELIVVIFLPKTKANGALKLCLLSSIDRAVWSLSINTISKLLIKVV